MTLTDKSLKLCIFVTSDLQTQYFFICDRQITQNGLFSTCHSLLAKEILDSGLRVKLRFYSSQCNSLSGLPDRLLVGVRKLTCKGGRRMLLTGKSLKTGYSKIVILCQRRGFQMRSVNCQAGLRGYSLGLFQTMQQLLWPSRQTPCWCLEADLLGRPENVIDR